MVQKKSHFQYLLIGHDKISALQTLMKGDINSRGKHDYIISEIYHIYYLDCI